jgi:hypothetical protein
MSYFVFSYKEMLVETINRNESQPVAENSKNENLFVSSNDNIEMLVEIINRNQSKLVAQSSKKENLFVKSDPTYECQDFNIDSVVNVNNGYFLYGKLDRKSDLLP